MKTGVFGCYFMADGYGLVARRGKLGDADIGVVRRKGWRGCLPGLWMCIMVIHVE